MKAMLLSAGLGQRLRPITNSMPKALVPLFGVPIIEHNLRWLAEYGIHDVLINLHHHPKKIMDALRDGSHLGIRIHYSLEPEILGTAGGIKKAESFFEEGPFVVVNSDTLRHVNLHDLLLYHQGKGGLSTLVLKANPRLPAEKAIWVNREGRIVRFLGQTHGGKSWAKKANFLGIHILERDVLSFIPRMESYEMNDQLYPRMLTRGRPLFGYLYQGPWRDLGTFRTLRETHFSVLSGSFSLKLEAREVKKGIWMGSHVRLGRDIRLRPPLFIGQGSRIEGKATIGPYAVIGKGCRVGQGAKLSRTIVFNGTTIEEGRAYRGRIVGKGFCV